MIMLLFKTLFVLFVIFVSGDAQEEPLRCIVADSECERIMYNGVLEKYAGGIPNLEVHSVDPMELQDISVSIFGALNLKLINGVGKGIKRCKFVELTSIIGERNKVKIHKECNITVEGRFRISSSDHIIKEMLGVENLDGEGNGTLELNGLDMFLEFPYTFYRHDNGEVYLKSFFTDIIYTKYEIRETKFTAKELFFNSQEANNFVVKFLNENSSFMMTSFGREVVNKAMQFYHIFCEKFLPTCPAKIFFKSDLTPFVTN